MPWTREDLTRLVELEAHQRDIDPKLALALVEQESGFNPQARSPKGAIGLMQLMPKTAAGLKVDPYDVPQNISGGLDYLKQQLDAFGGDTSKALAAYNAGPGVVKAYGKVPPYKETQGYVSRILSKLGPASAEAATPQAQPQAAGMSRLQELEAHLARLEGQAAPQAPQAAQEPAAAPDDQAHAADALTRLRASQAGAAGLQPPPADMSALAGGGGPSQQAQPVTDPAALLAVGGRPPAPAPPTAAIGPSGPPPNLDTELQAQLTPAQQGMPLLLGGAGAGALGRSAGAWAAGKLGSLGTALPIVGEGLANLGFRKGAVAAGMEEPGTAGDVAAVAAPAALGMAAPLVAKVGNALRGVVKPAAQSVVDTANKYGIRLSYGDVTQGSVAPKLESALEAIPGTGAGRMRVGQQQDVTKAGETIQTGLKTEMQQTPWRDLASVKQAAAGTGPRAKEAQVLLAEISEAGDDWGRVVQTSGKLNLFQDRVRAEKLYNRVEELAQPLGNMRLPKATQAIDDAIARASDDVLPSPEVKREVIGALNRIKGEINPSAAQPQPSMGVRDPVTGTLRAAPVTQATHIPDTTYMRMRRLRSALGDLQREAAEPATARYLSGVKTALEEDMAEFAAKSNVPGLAKAAKDADTFYRTRIVPYREGTLAKAIEKNLPDEIYNQFVRRGKDRAEYFYKGLDAKGQAAVRYGMVEEAIEKATSGKPDIFSPARFATSLKKIQDAHGVFFKGTPQWEINGITKLMQHAERAGQYAENPPTGLRGALVGTMIGSGGMAAVPWAVQTLLVGQPLRMLLMTQRGRNLLLAASDMQPGSSALQKRLEAYLRTLPAGAEGAGATARAREGTTAP